MLSTFFELSASKYARGPERVSDERAPMSWASTPGVRRSILANKRRDTGPELAIRSSLHALGLRYRVDFPPVRGLRRRADIAFTRRRIAIFIDGCFWHGCPLHATYPKRNSDYWLPKLRRNIERDRETDEQLSVAGWIVLRIWEHEDPLVAARRIEQAVRTLP